ncbi:MAG: hypothetical protein DLM62_12635 [Pseudonocardiales bacterium]|nr:MAG: hypothetical protein DLM62_12635 [Pseudonocardiales bacterium]
MRHDIRSPLAAVGRWVRTVGPERAHLRADGPRAVVLRLRRRTSLGATFVKVVTDYADRLAEVDGRLYLSGLAPSLTDRLRRAGHLDGPVCTFEATPVVGESTRAASLDAEAWLVTRHNSGG